MTTPTNTAAPEAPDTGTTTPEPSTQQQDDQAPDRDVEIAALKSEAAKWRKALREREAEIEQLKLVGASDADKAVAAARAEGASQYAAKWRRTVLENAALAALAEKGVTATEPALRSLDLDEIEVDDTGKVDRATVASKVDDLLTRYPMFAPQGSAPSLPAMTGDAQRRVTTTSQLRQGMTDAEVERALRYGMGGGGG